MSYAILLLEDDRLFAETIEDFLHTRGYSVTTCFDPYSALDRCYEKRFDLYLLDVNLPFEDGFSFLRQLRESDDTTPAIFLTSREGIDALKEGFGSGGDDFLRKPFDLTELQLRIEALLRRELRTRIVSIGALRYDLTKRQLFDAAGNSIVLSPKARLLLELLLKRRGMLVDIETIKATLWASAEEASEGAIRVYIAQLKRHLGDAILNERGLGYRLKEV